MEILRHCKPQMVLTEKELKLISIIRKIKNDELKIYIQDREPIIVEEIKRAVKL